MFDVELNDCRRLSTGCCYLIPGYFEVLLTIGCAVKYGLKTVDDNNYYCNLAARGWMSWKYPAGHG